MKKAHFFGILLVAILILLNFSFSAEIEEAKEVIENYYQYSKLKDLDSYVELFDENYLISIYGENYRDFFKEVFNYFKIESYQIDYQYYTESQETLSVFFNVRTKIVIEGNEIEQDNDMVAFFTKSMHPLLRFVILQEDFIALMNREFVFDSAVAKYSDSTFDLEKEAEVRGVSLADYSNLINEKIETDKKNHTLKFIFRFYFIFLGIAILLTLLYFYKRQEVNSFVKKKGLDKKFQVFQKKFRVYLRKIVKFFVIILKKCCIEIKKVTLELIKKIKKS